MLTSGGYPFFKCKTKWEGKNAIDKGKIEENDPQEHSHTDCGGVSTQTGVCDCEQCGAQEKGQEA